MRRFFSFLFLAFHLSLFAVEVDFDYVFVGTSPVSLLEALYRSYSGSRVLVLEAQSIIGGAWRTIDICGVPHVDMGCHQIGTDVRLKKFMEGYVGCNLVPMNNPCGYPQSLQSTDSGFYFSHGCYELMSQLYLLVQKSDIVLLLNHKLDSVYLDFARSIAEIKTNGKRYTVSKLAVTPNTQIAIENFPQISPPSISKHYHLYLLIKDSSPARFTYYNGICKGMSRIINLTPFCSELKESGHQLIAIQTLKPADSNNPEFYLEELKKKQWIDPFACLVASDTYIYEQHHLNQPSIQNDPQIAPFFEVLKTDALWNIGRDIERWEKVLRTRKETPSAS